MPPFKNSTIIFLLLGIFQSSLQQESTASTMPTLALSAMTYNIQMFVRNQRTENTIGDLLLSNTWRPTFLVMQEAWANFPAPIGSSSRAIQQRARFANATHSQHRNGTLTLYGNGLSTMTDWNVLETDRKYFTHGNLEQFETPKNMVVGGAAKGFTYVRVQHRSHPNARILIYNLHGMADKVQEKPAVRVFGITIKPRKLDLDAEKKAYENFQQLANHVREMSNKYPNDAVLVGGDFNWRHRWRPSNARVGQGDIDQNDYNRFFADARIPRYDVFGEMMNRAGLTDYERALTGSYAWSTPVDRWFFKSGIGITITPTSTAYWADGTPWNPLSDHNPFVLYFNLTFS